MVDEEIPLDGPVPVRPVITDEDNMPLVVLLTRMTEPDVIPVPIGTVGPAEAVLLVPLPYGAPLELMLEERPLETCVLVGFAVFEEALLVVFTGE